MQIQYELLTSSATVVLAIVAILIFIYSGATALFYVFVLLALVIGFFNAWLISRGKSMGEMDISRFGIRMSTAKRASPPQSAPRRRRRATAKP